jgi:hypothetical protein
MGTSRAILAAALLLAPAASAAPPAGQSALLNGMHDIESLDWMKNATPGCDKGWITDLQYIGSSGTAGPNCHDDATGAGVSIIQRLDLSGSESFPTNSGDVAGFAQTFASFAAQCPKLHVFIMGNEPNFSVNKSDPDCSAPTYAAAYVAVHGAVHAQAGHEQDLLLIDPNSPYSPGCLESLREIIAGVTGAGVVPDGFALHAYTRAPNGGALTAALVSDGATQNDGTIDECAGGATWNDTWHSHFRIYRDYIGVIEAAGLGGKPVFISESGNACDVAAGNACYPDGDVGYFQALYAEADQWNATAGTKIRAITPYRWTKNDDGTGRDFEIGSRAGLLSDLTQAFAAGYAWTTPGCGGAAGAGGSAGAGGASGGSTATGGGTSSGGGTTATGGTTASGGGSAGASSGDSSDVDGGCGCSVPGRRERDGVGLISLAMLGLAGRKRGRARPRRALRDARDSNAATSMPGGAARSRRRAASKKLGVRLASAGWCSALGSASKRAWADAGRWLARCGPGLLGPPRAPEPRRSRGVKPNG